MNFQNKVIFAKVHPNDALCTSYEIKSQIVLERNTFDEEIYTICTFSLKNFSHKS